MLAMDVEIKIDFDSVLQSESSLITGNIFIKTESMNFPEEDWNDFIVVITSWWAKSLTKFIESGTDAELRFMDGPFFLKIEKQNRDTVNMYFYENDKLEHKTTIEIYKLIKSLLSGINRLILECKSKQIVSTDVENLKNTYNSLQRAFKIVNKEI